MTDPSPGRRLAAVLTLAAALAGGPATAAEIRLLSAGAMKDAVLAVLPGFERESGHTVKADFDTAGALKRRIDAGETADAVIVTRGVLDALAKDGKVVPETRRDLGRVEIGIAVRTGAPRPAIGSVEAVRATLLAAKAVVYADPAAGASSGIHFASVLKRLGIADEVNGRALLVPGGYVVERVAEGRADLGIHQVSEILPVHGVELIGKLPPELQLVTLYSGGASVSARDPAPAAALLAYMKAPAARAVLATKGIEAAE